MRRCRLSATCSREARRRWVGTVVAYGGDGGDSDGERQDGVDDY